MRATVRLEVTASTIDEAKSILTEKWQKLVNDNSAELPIESDIEIQSISGDDDKHLFVYTGRVRYDSL